MQRQNINRLADFINHKFGKVGIDTTWNLPVAKQKFKAYIENKTRQEERRETGNKKRPETRQETRQDEARQIKTRQHKATQEQTSEKIQKQDKT